MTCPSKKETCPSCKHLPHDWEMGDGSVWCMRRSPRGGSGTPEPFRCRSHACSPEKRVFMCKAVGKAGRGIGFEHYDVDMYTVYN